MKNIDFILNKLRYLTNSKTDKELCEVLNINYSTLDTWKNNDNIPKKRLLEFSQKLNIPFGDLNQNNVIQDVKNYGNNSGVNNGSMNFNTEITNKKMFDDEILTILKSISPIVENNQSKKDSFKKNLKLWLVENI